MPTNSRFAPNQPLPRFLAIRVDEDELSGRAGTRKPRKSILAVNAGILVMTTALIGIAFTVSWADPTKVFADIKASVSDMSSVRTDTVHSTRSIEAASNSQALPPAAPDPSARDESSPAVDGAGQKQAAAGALLEQFQAWATTQDRPAQDGSAQEGSAQEGSIYVARAQPADDDRAQPQPVRPLEIAPAQNAQDDEAPVRTVRRHRIIRPIQNARAEMRSVRQRQARVRQDRIARLRARPTQQAPAQQPPAQPVQSALPPSLAQSLGWQQ